MAHYLLLFYLTCLVSIVVHVRADSCNTTGTFDSCCPSLDNEVITVQGKEFRVHCNSYISQATPPVRTALECINSCSSTPGCVGAHLKQAANARFPFCEQKLQSTEAKTVSFVLVDPTDKTKLQKDLDDCQRDLKNITPCDQNCPGALQKCQEDLSNCHPENPDCAGNLKTCRQDLDDCKSRDSTCSGKLDKCVIDKTKCEEDLERYKKRANNFCCSETKVQTVGGGSYRHHCNQVTTPASPNPFRSQHQAESIEECAKLCTKNSGCQWVYYVVHSKNCALGRGGWNHQTKNAFTTPGATGKGCTVLEKV
ncbi:uncharacterized protein FTOL_01425 [Fusarium torulosum]|uniref:Apple domain-containing protein n=1 Tax=Fusarium torulosum TaxID=33205 RepID=A0AAE8LZZ7_9HYPO|nr:uncharacterized protein FTOL_01425 [Fusarium torulosum]